VIGKIHADQVEIDTPAFAAYLVYHRYNVMKCTSGATTVWTFLVPSCDLEIMRGEVADKEATIFVKPFMSAFTTVLNFQELARRSYGEHTSQAWRDVIQQRRERI